MNTKETIETLAPWFHNIHLPDGRQTSPNHFLGDFPRFKWENIKHSIPEDLTGMQVLDIGCNAGYYSIQLALRGAQVLGIDLDDHYLRQAKWAAKQFGLQDNITFKKMQVYDLTCLDGEFDIVWFMGVFYHLRYPMLAMDIVTQKVKHILVFQTLSIPGREEMEVPEDIEINKREVMKQSAYPVMAFIEHRLAGDPTNWWAPNHQGVLSILRSCGFKVISMPEDETFIAQKLTGADTAFTAWNYSEYLSAIGKGWDEEVKIKTGTKI